MFLARWGMRATALYIAFAAVAMFGVWRAPSQHAKTRDDLSTRGHFEANLGQFDPQAAFLVRGTNHRTFLSPGRLVTLVAEYRNDRPEVDGMSNGLGTTQPRSATAVHFTLSRASNNGQIIPAERLENNSNYLRGASENWITAIPNYAHVVDHGSLAGVSIVWDFDRRGLRPSFVVEKADDLDELEWLIDGASGVTVSPDGSAKVSTPTGETAMPRPFVTDRTGSFGRSARYRILGDTVNSRSGMREFKLGVSLAEIDEPSLQEIPDDEDDLLYGGFLVSGLADDGLAIAVNAAGEAFITGTTQGTDFPTTAGSFDVSANGSVDVFVAKINSAGSSRVYSTYLGGSGLDAAYGIALDPTGTFAHVAGRTADATTDFPTQNAFDSTHNGRDDAFVSKLNADGSGLIYSTFLGGPNLFSDEFAWDVAVDGSGNAYVTGVGGEMFPTTPGAFDTSHAGGTDAFISKLSPSGSLVYSTYIGGGANDAARGIDVDSDGNAYIGGVTGPSTGYPTTPGSFDTTLNGGFDAFVTKLNPAGSALVFSTYIGGWNEDAAFALAVDTAGNAHITGRTASDNTISPAYPTTAGAFDQTYNGGFYDVFATKLNATGTALVWSTFLGGDNTEAGNGIDVDPLGNTFLTGFTLNTATNFPTTSTGFDTTHNGSFDVFLTALEPTGAMGYSTFLGGGGPDIGYGVFAPGGNIVYASGSASANVIPFPSVPGSIFSDLGEVGGLNVYAVKMQVELAGGPTPTPTITPSPTPTPPAGSLIVTNANDSGPGSLRQAIADVPTGGTIEFDPVFFNVQRNINLTGNEILITRDMTINGPGAHRVSVIGPGNTRVFRVTAQVALIGLTITGGNVGASNGGGISNIGNLIVRDCHVTGNTGAFGGGISNQGAGQLAVINSAIINNTGVDRGGGIDSTGILSVQNSTISSNITTDTSGQNGGGIWTREASIINSTITNNAALGPESAGGIYRDAGSLTLRSSIIAANTNNATLPDVFAVGDAGIASLGYNLIGNRGSLTFNGTADQSGTGAARVDPLLADLANNGGNTPTHALRANSPALDKGISPTLSTDQRGMGFIRPVDLPIANATGGDGSDIGAFEAQTDPADALFSINGRVFTPNGLALRSITVLLTDSTSKVRTATTSSFGNYTFANVEPGNYVVSLRSKRYRFAAVNLTVSGNVNDLNFTGLE